MSASVFTLESSAGLRAKLTDLGANLMALEVPDAKGDLADVVLGYDTPERYAEKGPYLGATVGRVANRIANARFELDGNTYELAKNDDPHCLHGGAVGFNRRPWSATQSGSSVTFERTSPDGEEGFPGELKAKVTFTLEGNELRIDFEATTDAPTVVALCHHSYWNLGGQDHPSVDDHLMQIHANRFTPIDATLIPTGELADLDGTPFDFRDPKPIGQDVEADHEQLRRAGGYDHNFQVDLQTGDTRPVALVEHPASGRTMRLLSDQPGVQFYSGNMLDGTLVGKGGRTYGKRKAFCLETQAFPNAVNTPSFPTVRLNPGEKYVHRMVHRFGNL